MGFFSNVVLMAVSPLLLAMAVIVIFVSGYQSALKRGKNNAIMEVLGRNGCVKIFSVLTIIGKTFPELLWARLRKEAKAKAKLLDKVVPLKKAETDKPVVCFTGSSTFTFWLNLETYFPKYNVYNAAFGGSVTGLVLEFVDNLVIKHRPQAVVYYCGTNDMSLRLPAKEIYENFKLLHERVRAQVSKDVGFIYVSMLPTPSNMALDSPDIITTMLEVNRKIETFCKSESKTIFIDAASEPFVSDPEFFLYDNKHLLPRGHRKLAALISPALDRLGL